MHFWLGSHMPNWLSRTDVPLFISRRRLSRYKTPPVAIGPWALDSGGFSELSMFGEWQTSPRQYIDEVRRWRDTVGNLAWAAIQDWMCEPFIVAKTGKSVAEHQSRTVHSYMTLKSLAPEIPWIPVLQGWRCDDYLEHLDEYHRAIPFPLSRFRLVGVGSVCRRQGTEEALNILRSLRQHGLKLHGFGFKIDGLRNGGCELLASADSMAWSKQARHKAPLPGCQHAACNNCLRFALNWRDRVLKSIEVGNRNYQPTLFS